MAGIWMRAWMVLVGWLVVVVVVVVRESCGMDTPPFSIELEGAPCLSRGVGLGGSNKITACGWSITYHAVYLDNDIYHFPLPWLPQSHPLTP